MSDSEKIDAYLAKHEQWLDILPVLRQLLRDSELEETVKWGAPTYTLEGKIVISIVGFKNHCALWFHQGVFLKDEKGKLVNAQEGRTKGMRQWRFEAGDGVERKLVKSYIAESIANEQSGKRVKPAEKALEMPEELADLVASNKRFSKKFAALTPGRQREYAQHIGGAKQASTRASRLEKVKPKIEVGLGLNDKYRNA